MEHEFRNQGYKIIAGVDEAGRGPLAGPVVAAAVILPERFDLKGLTDSKKLTALRREKLSKEIKEISLAWHIETVSVEYINEHNILKATLYAMKNCIEKLNPAPDCVLIDGNQTVPGVNIPQKAIIKGDMRCKTISSASILAKVHRDEIMQNLHIRYPLYKFDKNKGYGSKAHLEALKEFGATPCHRKYYAPVAEIINTENKQMELMMRL
ncbi:MAG: ribonuclease HII [Armatimonadota bacterium]